MGGCFLGAFCLASAKRSRDSSVGGRFASVGNLERLGSREGASYGEREGESRKPL